MTTGIYGQQCHGISYGLVRTEYDVHGAEGLDKALIP
jgi:hypothetical protein